MFLGRRSRRHRSAQAQTAAFGFLRAIAAIGALAALAYAIREILTAEALSRGATFGWRAQLFLLEGGAPLIITLGCGCVAWGSPRLRKLGLCLIVLTVIGLILWGTFAVTPDRLAIGVIMGGNRLDPLALTPLTIAVVLDQAGRSRIVEAAYRQYSDDLISFAGAISTHSDADVAEEAVHDVFEALLTGQRDDVLQRDESGFRAHLFSAVKQRAETVCRSERRRAYRTSRMKEELCHELPSTIPTPSEQYCQSELEQRLRAELKSCSARGVEAFHLVHECGLSYAEAATVMGITVQGVGSHLSRTIRHLRDRLRDWDNSSSTVRVRAVAGEALS